MRIILITILISLFFVSKQVHYFEPRLCALPRPYGVGTLLASENWHDSCINDATIGSNYGNVSIDEAPL